MGIIFWLIIIIILLTSVLAWVNTKIILEKLAEIKASIETQKENNKIRLVRHSEKK